jgi:hypothetical protein
MPVSESLYQKISPVRAPDAQARPKLPSVEPPRPGGGPGPARLGHRLADISTIPGAAPVQRKIKVLAPAGTYDSVVGATARITDNCAPLAAPLTSAEQYTLKTENDMRELALGRQADVLVQKRHVIGENHALSSFDLISGQWPGVATMGEGVYTTKETPELPATQGQSHATFARNFRSGGVTTLPLENFHAAAYGRLTAFVLCWNEYRADQITGLALFKEKVADFANLYNAYANVAAGVFIRGMDNSWLGFSPRYSSKIEEAYGAMYRLVAGADSLAAMAKVNAITTAVDGGQPVPAISLPEFTRVQRLAGAMFPVVSSILTASMAAKPGADAVKAESDSIDTYAAQNVGTLRMADQAAALVKVKAVREHFMGEQIRVLPKPGLVKVGRAHILGLTGQNLPDTLLYNDAVNFNADIRKSATDL